MEGIKKGYVQIYTGDGKGKTTAAVGLGVRAAGNGFTVFMVQFLKSSYTGELKVAEMLKPYFNIFRFEKKRGFFWTLNEEEKKELQVEIKEALKFCFESAKEKKCDVLIMDEIMGALHNKLVTVEEILEVIDNKPEGMEIILTGRNAPEELVARANLVTEMKEIKHYYAEGVPARKGIEF